MLLSCEIPSRTSQGLRRGRGWGGGFSPPHFFEKIKINWTKYNLTKIREPKIAPPPHSKTCCTVSASQCLVTPRGRGCTKGDDHRLQVTSLPLLRIHDSFYVILQPGMLLDSAGFCVRAPSVCARILVCRDKVKSIWKKCLPYHGLYSWGISPFRRANSQGWSGIPFPPHSYPNFVSLQPVLCP